MVKIPSYIICLLIDSLKGRLNSSDSRRLQKWLETHPEHQTEIGRLKDTYKNTTDAIRFKNIDTNKAWATINSRTAPRARWRRKVVLHRYEIAAGLIFPLVIGIILLQHPGVNEQITPAITAETPECSPEHSTQAILELSSGEQIVLDKSVNQKIQSAEGLIVGIDSTNTIAITHAGDSVKASEKPNRIYVPVGGEYSIILCDGTKVWVNSDSRLTFPNHFYGPERTVELSGEAYFEVSKNGKPFIVNTGSSSIRVLGTAFNVCSYHDEKSEQITLVNGAVKVKVGEKNYPLRPGQQLISRKSSEKVEIKEVDTELYTSWRNDLFRFVDLPIEDITLKLKRWYNVCFIFKNEQCKKYRFTGAARKDGDLQELLRRIEATNPNIQFKINNNEIEIIQK